MTAATLHERFAAQVDKDPEAVALVEGDREHSYADLAEQADRLRRRLRRAGVTPGSLVGLVLPRGAAVASSILGILAHGCGYVPVDPAYPRQRQEYLLTDAQVAAVVAADDDSGQPQVARVLTARPHPVPQDTAYVIYTSGSTGAPKGVVVGHRQVLALLDACDRWFDFSAGDVWTLFHSHSFDFSVWELWGALLHGAMAVVVPQPVAADPRALARLLAREQVTVLNQVPTSFGYLVTELEEQPVPLPSLRYVVFGGEAVSMPTVARFRQLGVAPQAELINMYGITETTVHVTFCRLGAQVAQLPGATPIGQPLPHLRVALVDEQLTPVPAGAAGEMLVAGGGVAHGYLGRAELTGQRFVTIDGIRYYRSGDWAVQDAAGDLHYLGRRDRQLQLRGFRIELGEIEHAAAGHPAVAACAVTVHAHGGDPMLVGHYATRPGAQLEPAELAAYLTGRLPTHYRPARWHRHAALPVTDHGKVDYARLAAAEADPL